MIVGGHVTPVAWFALTAGVAVVFLFQAMQGLLRIWRGPEVDNSATMWIVQLELTAIGVTAFLLPPLGIIVAACRICIASRRYDAKLWIQE